VAPWLNSVSLHLRRIRCKNLMAVRPVAETMNGLGPLSARRRLSGSFRSPLEVPEA
jgi:hypothetical protein